MSATFAAGPGVVGGRWTWTWHYGAGGFGRWHSVNACMPRGYNLTVNNNNITHQTRHQLCYLFKASETQITFWFLNEKKKPILTKYYKWVSVSWQHENLVNVTLKTFFFYSHTLCMQTSLQSAQCFADQSVKQYKSGSFVKITSRIILFSDLTFRQWLYTNKYDNKNNVAIDSFKQITQYKECNGASKGHSMQVSAGLRMNDLLSLEMTECPIFGMTSIPWTNLMTGLQWKWNRSFKNPAESMFNVASTWSSSWK